MTQQVITVGRGHSGTRVMMHTLEGSGFFVGKTNGSGDHLPPHPMYRAVRRFGRLVKGEPGAWDFTEPLNTPYPIEYLADVQDYLSELVGHEAIAWKLPEATLALPWLVQVFPDAYYIHWVRDGRDNILRWHGTENDWYGVDVGELPEDRRMKAAMSWDYHEELIAQTPKPEHWLKVRFEDFILHQEEELERLEDYLDCHLCREWVNARVVGRYRSLDMSKYLPVLERHLEAHGYISANETLHS
jgi:hypothetical protein